MIVLEPKVKELDTDVSNLVENEAASKHPHYEFTTTYDFVDDPEEGDMQ